MKHKGDGATARRWYQNVAIGDQEVTYESHERKESKFWNRGKWDNFIEPLLPKERRTFIEIGCNAGLFLKLATNAGFQNVIGVEANSRIMDQALCFKEHDQGTYKLVHQRVGANFELDQLPLADVVVISNMHYYLPVSVFSKLIDNLKSRCLYCLVVSAKAKRRSGNALYDLYSVRGYFRDWREMRVIEGLDDLDDPAPRKEMYSILFKGSLDAWDVGDRYNLWCKSVVRADEHKRFALPPALKEFFEKVLSGEEFNPGETLLYQYWAERRPQAAHEWILAKLAYKQQLAEDVRANGMKDPIYYDQKGKLLDGIHRLVIANELGYKHILVRRL